MSSVIDEASSKIDDLLRRYPAPRAGSGIPANVRMPWERKASAMQ